MQRQIPGFYATLIIISLFFPSFLLADDSSYSLSQFTKSLNLKENSFPAESSGSFDTEMGKVSLTFSKKDNNYYQKLHDIVITSLKQIKVFLQDNKFTNFQEFEQLEWNIIFRGFTLDENNRFNSKYFHYALVGPPADIVVDISQFINSNGELDTKEMKKTIVHEFSHVIEYVLLGKSFSRRERWHGEGFAVWMTDKILNEESVKHYYINSRWKTMYFAATPEDYYYSYLIFKNIESSYGIDKVFELYGFAQNNPKSFKEILNQVLSSSPESLMLKSYYR